MPTVHCIRCGRPSNSAISEYVTRTPFVEGQCDGCYAAWNVETNTWERGCLYGTNSAMTTLADYLINTSSTP
jgi:hypothetical protein